MTAVKNLTTEELQTLIKTTVEETMQELMENLLALNNPKNWFTKRYLQVENFSTFVGAITPLP